MLFQKYLAFSIAAIYNLSCSFCMLFAFSPWSITIKNLWIMQSEWGMWSLSVWTFWLMFSQFGSNPLKSRRYFHLFAKQASFHLIVRLFLIDFRLRLQTLHLIQHNLLLPYLIVQFRRCASLYRLLSAILHNKPVCWQILTICPPLGLTFRKHTWKGV